MQRPILHYSNEILLYVLYSFRSFCLHFAFVSTLKLDLCVCVCCTSASCVLLLIAQSHLHPWPTKEKFHGCPIKLIMLEGFFSLFFSFFSRLCVECVVAGQNFQSERKLTPFAKWNSNGRQNQSRHIIKIPCKLDAKLRSIPPPTLPHLRPEIGSARVLRDPSSLLVQLGSSVAENQRKGPNWNYTSSANSCPTRAGRRLRKEGEILKWPLGNLGPQSDN